ncbi:MAG: orotate phosphoribosyltransferase [Gaiella sp.]|nr:orotate phosphoribosyltransferase [Gaiella sp.]
MSAVDELGRRLVDVALLEGDFTLRSGRRSRWYLDKYRFETEPGLLRELGERLAAAIRESEPGAARIGGPALGAVALAASAAMASGLPFIIVRGEAKEYATGNRIEGPHEPGEVVCLVEDVVTSGGALREAVEAVRAAGLVVRHAVCVVDREEGGADALARLGVRLASLYRAGELLATREQGMNPHG